MPLNAPLAAKIQRALSRLASLGSVLAAFSGGLDSTLLLYLAARALPGRVLALTVSSPLNSPADLAAIPRALESLRELRLDFRHEFLAADVLSHPRIKKNPPDRCYWCKKVLTEMWFKTAGEKGLAWVVEGSQADDEGLYRPGRQALKEAGVLSPLAEAGLTKAEIKTALAHFGVWGAERPGQACLASRIPYGRALTRPLLRRIGQTETLLAAWGIHGPLRARAHNKLLRLEVEPGNWAVILENELWPERLAALKGLGWEFVTLDLAGFNSGVFDKNA